MSVVPEARDVQTAPSAISVSITLRTIKSKTASLEFSDSPQKLRQIFVIKPLETLLILCYNIYVNICLRCQILIRSYNTETLYLAIEIIRKGVLL